MEQHDAKRMWDERMRQVRQRMESAGPVPNFTRLLEVASADTGSSRRVAQFLLSLWNGDQYKCDLQAVLYLDADLFDELSNLFNYLQRKNLQLDSLVSEEEMRPIVHMWGSVFAPR